MSAAGRASGALYGVLYPLLVPWPRRHPCPRVPHSSGFANSAPTSGGLDLRGIEALYQRYKGWAGGAVWAVSVGMGPAVSQCSLPFEAKGQPYKLSCCLCCTHLVYKARYALWTQCAVGSGCSVRRFSMRRNTGHAVPACPYAC